MKSQHNNKMEAILKNKFEQFTPAPPAGLFAAIEPQIEHKATKKTVFFTYARLAVAACFVFLLGIGYLYLWPANTTNYNNIANTKTPRSSENSDKQGVTNNLAS